ncbi:MAG: type IV secretory system conjugative DNA transfer family protein [Bacilli bacterium]|nr:type IV secretory system conjugative DNA transfer family protein [Bacilli bacterium]
MDSIRFDPISYPMLILLFIVIGMIIFILIIEPRLSRRKLANKNEHGSSKFADFKEIKKNFDKENLYNIDKVGFPVWYEKINNTWENVYFDTKSPHYLLVGSTGSGKSATVSLNMAIHFATAKEKHSVVFTDPKAELFNATGKIFKDNGYEVVTIDFRNPMQSNKINVMQPIIDEWKEHCHFNKCMMLFLSHFLKVNKINVSKLSNDKKYKEQIKDKYNLEDYIIDIIISNNEHLSKEVKNKKLYDTSIIDNYEKESLKEFLNNKTNEALLNYIKDYQNSSAKHQAETNRLVISLANLIFTEKNAKDPFWINSSKQLFVGLSGIFLEDYKAGLIDENKINIASIKKFQNSSLIKENQNYLQRNLNSRPYGSLSKDYLTSILSAAENTYKSVTAVFGEKMSIFDDLNVENITSVSEFNFTNLGKKPVSLYIIVPDEDKAYFQLVTIIVGMLIKDLTKFANLKENRGVLPVPVEWILDEFANCPPLDSIETIVSVARSRKMRFYFFIQSFAQLDQVYGKEIASIIQDNCALVYLKTNTVETAEVIAKKLGKSTIETNSMSMSTDPFKVGANQTKSLMGKELLTATEIISLKYKTIIFPTFGNPIFRDTYLYSDLYPKYKNYPIYERDIKILKRLTENYYTVEKLRENLDSKSDKNTDMLTRQVRQSFQRNTNRQVNKIINNIKQDKTNDIDILLIYVEQIKSILKNKVLEEFQLDDRVFVIEMTTSINKFELERIKKLKDKNILLETASSKTGKKTILTIWEKNLDLGRNI